MTDLAELLTAEFALTVRTVEVNDVGIDRSAQRFKVYADSPHTGPRWYAVKWSSGGSVAGLLIPAALAGAGVVGVPGPLPARDGQPWVDRPADGEPRRLSVVPWIGTRPAIDSGLTEPQWRAFGVLMAAVHRYQLPASLRGVLPRVGHARELAAVARTDDLVTAGVVPSGANQKDPDLAVQVAALWRAHRDRIMAAAAAVPQLAVHIEPAVLCHADPHLGNILADDTTQPPTMWLVDWDDATLATPEHDLMFVLGATYGSEHIGDRERAWFAAGYLGVDDATPDELMSVVDPPRLRYYRLVRALIDVADLVAETLSPDTAPAWRQTAARLVAAELSPAGLLALAGC